MSSTLERIQKLEEQMAQVVARLSNPDPMIQMLMNKSIGIEQSVAAMGKTLSAVSEELTENGVMDGASVMARLRRGEDDANRQNVKTLLDQDVIESTDVVSPVSVVVLEQKIINTKTGEATLISSYNLIGMNSPITSPVWKDSLLGKSVGDTVKGIDGNDEEEILTVKEIYVLKERDVEGEEEPEAPAQTEESETSSSEDESVEEISFDDGAEEEPQAQAEQ